MKALKFLRDADADVSVLNNKIVAVLGYGNQGRAQAQNLRDSGVSTIIGGRPGKSSELASQEGFEVLSVPEAVKKADIIHILLPDERQGEIFHAEIAPALIPGKTLCVSHGFAFVFGEIVTPEGVNAIMVSPKGPGADVRSHYLRGSGLAGLIAVKQDATGNARDIALALAYANGFTRTGVLEVTMEQETHGDLFGGLGGKGGEDPVDPAIGVTQERAGLARGKIPLDGARCAHLALIHPTNRHVGDLSPLHGDELARIPVADAVPQPREDQAIGEDEGDGTDPRAAIPHP